MSSRPRPRSASLKALPPDQPAQAVEVQNISAAVHWSVNSKDKPGFGQRQRPLKSVSLKLAKGDGSPTASTRSNSAGAAWGSGELLVDGRQCIRQAGSGPQGPPSRGSATEAEKAPTRSRQSPLPRPDANETPAVGRPPVPKDAVEVSAHPSTSSYPSRATAAALDDETSSRPSSASYQRAAAIYASLPKTPGGTRTLVRDADGFIFRPNVEAEVKASPAQPRLRPGSRGLNELVASLAKRKPREAPRPVPAPVEASFSAPETSTAEPPVPAVPRIAWSEGSPDDAENFLDAADMAAQIRRDWLAKQLSELEEASASAESQQDVSLRTEDGRRSMGELEKSLAKAKEKAERNRKELKGYMESLRSKLFQEDDLSTKEELLVSLPPDFDDVVDINASLTAAERRRSRRNSMSSGGGAFPGTGGSAELSEGFRLPSFLEKYFYEDKALPIVQMEQQESELDKVSRQVARLDSLLSRREADGVARLQAAKEELEATKEHLRRESEQSEAEKIELLRKLKEKGFLRSQSSNTSKAASAASSSANSPRHSTSVSCVSPSRSEREVDWSGWECSAEADAVAKSAPLVAKPEAEAEVPKEEEADTSTFNLTATTADLSNLGQSRQRSSGKRSKLEPVVEDSVEGKGEEKEVAAGDELVVPSALPEELLHDPYDLNALHAIDDQLAQIVPESEWEAKSIRSATNGSEVSAGVQSKTSKHTVLSHLASSSLPGEPVLREQLEEREARKALIAIDDQLGRLQEQRHIEQLQPEQLQQLLLQAAASQSAMDASSKVLTLTAEAEDLEAALQRMLQPLRITGTAPVESSGPLVEAKKILTRLSESNEEWDSTNIEARCTMAELEDSLKALEERASRPNTAEKEDEETDELIVEMSTWAMKLEELNKEALMVAEQGLPQVQGDAEPEHETGGATGSGDLQAGSADLPDGDLGDLGDLGELVLPSLTTAEQEADPLSDVESDSSGNSPVFLPVAEVEVTKAVDLDLPEGRWSDEELERFSKAMEEHFGPVKRSFVADADTGEREPTAG